MMARQSALRFVTRRYLPGRRARSLRRGSGERGEKLDTKNDVFRKKGGLLDPAHDAVEAPADPAEQPQRRPAVEQDEEGAAAERRPEVHVPRMAERPEHPERIQ